MCKIISKIQKWYEKPYINAKNPDYVILAGFDGIEIIHKSEIKWQ